MSLCKVVNIDQNKCTNCHTCITVCPIKYCFYNGKTVKINDELCIGCGRCYHACPHDAISIIDDFQDFLDSMNRGEKALLIVSPAILMTFKDQHKKLITYLKENWVLNGIFDESLGAEIAVILYMQYIKKIGMIPVISQQCPTIIEYIKIFHPELLEYVAPFHSPAIIMAKLIKKILNFNGNIAYLGPCLSKRREFRDPDTDNAIQFNLTIENLKKYMEIHKTDLNKYKESDFDFLPAERGSVFCKPAGFINIAKRYYENPKMFHIEGKKIYKDYFKKLTQNIDNNFKHFPLMIDILNCEGGCFHGPAGINTLSIDEEIWYIETKEEKSISKYQNKFKAQNTFEKILENNNKVDLKRIYFSERAKPIHTSSHEELKEIYKSLNKNKKKDFLDCRSCGFYSCQEFSSSMFNNLNISTNCRHFIENTLKKTLNDNNIIVEEVVVTSDKIKSTLHSIMTFTEKVKNTFKGINKYTDSLKENNIYLKNNAVQFTPIILAILEVSKQINLLSLNASIEASRTGETGKGFSVVSTEIRKLADKTKTETDKIFTIMQKITNEINNININTDNLTGESSEFAEAIETLHDSIKDVNLAITDLSILVNKLNSFGIII
ncbi:MAG: 4Fe-4S binding protein [Spirochaetes bacterium]|nr:4Fe-4S binding protein [Spirochaetota bacterium]